LINAAEPAPPYINQQAMKPSTKKIKQFHRGKEGDSRNSNTHIIVPKGLLQISTSYPQDTGFFLEAK